MEWIESGPSAGDVWRQLGVEASVMFFGVILLVVLVALASEALTAAGMSNADLVSPRRPGSRGGYPAS